MTLAAVHANYSADWWTPLEWLDWVSATFGTRDWFDPCPATWQPGDEDGLESRWEDPTYLNHPGTKGRGAAALWWRRYLQQRAHLRRFIWCCFAAEQMRHMLPSCLELPGWLIAPRQRVAFIWGGPSRPETPKSAERIHGQPMRSPGNWTVFWSTIEPARPPVDCIVTRTGL